MAIKIKINNSAISNLFNNKINEKAEVKSNNVLNESILEDYTDNDPIENYQPENDNSIIGKLHQYAKKMYADITAAGFNTGDISDIKTYGDPEDASVILYYFDIEGDIHTIELGNYESYRIFQYNTKVYYIPVDEVVEIMEDFRYEDRTVIIHELCNQAHASVDISREDDSMFMVESVILSMYNYSTVNENCKIRRQTKIQADNDVDKSKVANDAKYGTKEENDFKQELEDKQKKDGTIGALDPAQEESVKPKLPNVNLITEKVDIIYEVNDPVIYNKELWHVYAIDEIGEDNQRLHITKNGQTQAVMATDVEPDPEFLKNLEENPPFDDENNISGMITRKDLKDLNKKTVECNIVVDGYIINSDKMKASLKDIVENSEFINVEDESGNVKPYSIDELSFEKEEWPYAVIAGEDDEPIRKIRVNPTSYVNAGEDDMVEILVADKETCIPKSAIRILS